MTPAELYGPTEGWSLAPVIGWLFGAGRMERDVMRFVEGLAVELDRAGAAIDRLLVASRTLHPQWSGWNVRWSRREGVSRYSSEHGTDATDAYIGSPIQHVFEKRTTFRLHVSAAFVEGEHSVVRDLRLGGIVDYAALPMFYANGWIGVLSVSTARASGFTDAEMARFAALARVLTPFFEMFAMRRGVIGILDTFIGPRISERILQGQVRRGDGERIDAAFWYSDLRGFTQLSETLPTADLLNLLNDYFEFCAAAAAARGGEILQFIGDAILIVFECGPHGDRARVCAAALDAAIDAFDSIAVVNHRRHRASQAEIRFGLGLHVGTVTHANVGAPDRLAFNVVGPAVNMTARIQGMTKELGVPLLVSAEFAGQVGHKLKSVGRHDLRGVAREQELFTPHEGA
jgi:adenylate cyclase